MSKILGVLGKVLPGGEEAERLQAEKELIEARAFARGRWSPRYVLGYVLVAVFGLACLVQLGHLVLPDVFPHSLIEDMGILLREAKELL